MSARLHGEDAAWLRMDDATNPMVVCALLELADVLPVADARELFRQLTELLPFSARVVEPALPLGTPKWRRLDSVDLDAHVEHVRLDTSSDAELRKFVGRTLSVRLDPSRPLWRAYLVDRPERGTVILFRVHHAVADGYALLGLLHALSGSASAVLPRRSTRRLPTLREHAVGLARAAERLLRLPPDPKTLLQGRLGGEKHVAWSRPVPLATVKRIGAASSTTVNDVIAAAVTGALRRYLARRGAPCDALELHAMMPVNMRIDASTLDLTNRFGLVILGLPVGIADPIARIGAVHRRAELLKGSAEAEAARLLLTVLGYLPRKLEDAVVTYFGRKASLVFTNLIGPRRRAALSGVTIERMMFWVPEAAHLGLGVSVFSYAGEVTVCVLSDGAVVADPEVLVADFEAELACTAERVA